MKKKNGTSKVLGVVAVLLCLVLVSSYFSSGMLARYVTRSDGADVSRIAALRVSAVTQEDTNAATEFTRTYTVTLSNKSDVAVRYEAAPVLPLPEGTTGTPKITVDGEALTDDVLSGELVPGGEKIVTLVLDLSGVELPVTDAFDSFSNEDVSTASGDLAFTVTVTFTQID
jgi:hypothetical protein